MRKRYTKRGSVGKASQRQRRLRQVAALSESERQAQQDRLAAQRLAEVRRPRALFGIWGVANVVWLAGLFAWVTIYRQWPPIINDVTRIIAGALVVLPLMRAVMVVMFCGLDPGNSLKAMVQNHFFRKLGQLFARFPIAMTAVTLTCVVAIVLMVLAPSGEMPIELLPVTLAFSRLTLDRVLLHKLCIVALGIYFSSFQAFVDLVLLRKGRDLIVEWTTPKRQQRPRALPRSGNGDGAR